VQDSLSHATDQYLLDRSAPRSPASYHQEVVAAIPGTPKDIGNGRSEGQFFTGLNPDFREDLARSIQSLSAMC